MSRHRDFEVQLENLRQEAGVAVRYIYAEMTIQHAASKSEALLDRLNETPTFWIACGAALQSAAYISLGRVFDVTSKFNIKALLDSLEASLHLFQRKALSERKRVGETNDPPWLAEYLDSAFYPTQRDVARLRGKVEGYRAIYERAVKPARNKYLAHREKLEPSEVKALFGGGTIKEMWRLTTFLVQLQSVLWEMLHNGRKPVFRPIRYSVKRIFDARTQSSEAHESMVREVKSLMSFIETATPNPSIEQTSSGKLRLPAGAAHVTR